MSTYTKTQQKNNFCLEFFQFKKIPVGIISNLTIMMATVFMNKYLAEIPLCPTHAFFSLL